MILNWTSHKTTAQANWDRAVWNGALYLVTAYGLGTGYEYSANGEDWTQGNFPAVSPAAGDNNAYSPAALDNGLFVVFTADSNPANNLGTVLSSLDAVNWDARASFAGYDYAASNGVTAWSVDQNYSFSEGASVISVDSDGNPAVYINVIPASPDLDWYIPVGVPGGGNLITAAWGEDKAAYSSNGQDWTVVDMPFSGSWSPADASSSNVAIFLSFGSATAARTKDGGATWDTITLPAALNWTGIKWLNASTWIAIATGTDTAYVTEDDGDTWEPTTLPMSSTWSAVVSSFDADTEVATIVVFNRTNPVSFDNVAKTTAVIPTPPPAPAGVAQNCDCDCGYETKTFAEMRNEVAVAMGYASTLPNLQAGVKIQIDQELNFQHRRVVEDITLIESERFFSWLLLPGVTKYCTTDNMETCRNVLRAARIFEAYLVNTQGQIVTRLVKGIPYEFHSGGDLARSQPTRYEVRSCIEVWPPPGEETLILVARGQLAATPLVLDTDTPSVTSDLIVMRTVAILKGRKGHQDAGDWMGQYRQAIGILNADSFIDTRHIPAKCAASRWRDRLTHVMEPRVYDETP